MVGFEQSVHPQSPERIGEPPIDDFPDTQLKAQIAHMLEMTREKIVENPWAAVGIALAAGVAVGMLAGPLLRAGEQELQSSIEEAMEEMQKTGSENNLG